MSQNSSGNLDIEGFIWLIEVSRVFDYTELSKNRKIKFVAYRLKEGASVQ